MHLWPNTTPDINSSVGALLKMHGLRKGPEDPQAAGRGGESTEADIMVANVIISIISLTGLFSTNFACGRNFSLKAKSGSEKQFGSTYFLETVIHNFLFTFLPV